MTGAVKRLAKLTRLEDLREVWPNEARNFSRWLCEEGGLEILGDELGFGIVLDEMESSVGEHRADVLAHEAGTGRVVIIENQLEETDHDHLGKLIVYGAGKEAEIVVWIVGKARDNHRRAVQWLNEHTDPGIGFFLVEVGLWKIGDSDPAVKFSVAERPNEWAKEQKMSGGEQLRFRFWTAFRGSAEESPEMKAAFSFRKPQPQSEYELAAGFPGVQIMFSLRTQKKCVQAGLYFHGRKELCAEFRSHASEIKDALDAGEVFWTEGGSDAHFFVERAVEPEDEASWPAVFDWLCGISLKLKELARKYGG